MHQKFQILSLDGGGIKGVFTAAVLAAIEDKLDVKIADHFDLIVGTSTGGIIALGLGLGVRPAEILKFYVQYGPSIFKPYFGARWLKSWILSKYPQSTLRDGLRSSDVFGERLFGESQKRLVIPSYSLTRDDTYLFRTPHCEHLTHDWKIEAWKIALATSAAPTYFPVSEHIDGIRHVDGGIWANNPTIVGIIEAKCFLGIDLDRISVLNICPLSDVRARPKRLSNGGILPWVIGSDITEIVMRAQSEGVFKQSTNLLGKENVLRLNPSVQAKKFGMDKAKTTTEMIAIASEVGRHSMPAVQEHFLGHIADKYVPIFPREGVKNV